MGNHCIESEHLTIEDCCIKMHDRLFMVLHSSICWMVSWIVDSHCVMEHAGLFRIITLVHLMVCSHVGLLKIVVFEIYQTEYYNFEVGTWPWWRWRWHREGQD